MNKLIEPDDVIAVIKSFLDINTGDEATEDLLLAVGAELLDVSSDTMNEIIQSRHVVEASDIKITAATLLSTEEAETLLTQEERAYNNWWWLRSPGYFQYYAANVYFDGSVFHGGYGVYDGDGCVRPALNINISSSNIKVGDVFMFGGKEFKVISPELAWMHKDDIWRCAFRKERTAPDANVYSASDVKKYVDAWFETVLSKN